MKQYTQSVRGKLFNYFQGKLGIRKSTNGFWRCNCFDCGGDYTMGINLEKSKVHCFKCGINIDPMRALIQLEGFETYQQARGFLQIQQEYEAYDRLINKAEKKEVEPITLPESFKLITSGENMMAKAARRYLEKRGFNIKRLALKGVGYCTKGEYGGYIVFPYYRKNELIYFQGRLYMGVGPKMKNPLKDKHDIGKTQIIYNEDALYMYNKIYIMESITNCLTLGDNTIGLSGKNVHKYQFSKIIQSPCSTVIILLDPDAWDKALSLGMQLVHYKNVKVIKLPGTTDVNELGKKKTMDFVKGGKFMKYMDLYKLKRDIHGKGSISTYKRTGPSYSATRGVA